ncbi:hypothetical protein BDV12DRAFT_45297 [Aspergillus spectabilis]
MTYRTALQCSYLCVRTAHRLINVMYENFATGQGWGAKPNWLYGVLHIYLSATVLLAARLRPSIRLNEISESDIEESWLRALKILETFQSDSLAAQRCVAALKTLYLKVPPRAGGGVPSAMADDNHQSSIAHHQMVTVAETCDHSHSLWTGSFSNNGYQALHPGLADADADGDGMASMLDCSWVSFLPEFPESVGIPMGRSFEMKCKCRT